MTNEALEKIAFMGMDAGMHCGDKEYFYRNQLANCISIAAKSLADQTQDHVEDNLDMVDRSADAGETISESAPTMDGRYGDGSDCVVCDKCGLCKDCGDCKAHGCKESAPTETERERFERSFNYMQLDKKLGDYVRAHVDALWQGWQARGQVPDAVVKRIRREIKLAKNPIGMSIHSGKVTLDISHVERLLQVAAPLPKE